MESEAQGEDAIEEGARLKLEEIIQTTDRLVADKGREVAELQSLLASQSGNLGAMAVGAAAVGQLIDQDSVVQQQRETLQRLQDQLMEKLRQAEIENLARAGAVGPAERRTRREASRYGAAPTRRERRRSGRRLARGRVGSRPLAGAAGVEGLPVSLGTVPSFVRRKWDCLLRRPGGQSHFHGDIADIAGEAALAAKIGTVRAGTALTPCFRQTARHCVKTIGQRMRWDRSRACGPAAAAATSSSRSGRSS